MPTTFALALYKMYFKECIFGILRGLPAEDTPLHQKVLSTLSVIIWITYHPKPPFQIDGQRRVNLMESEGKLESSQIHFGQAGSNEEKTNVQSDIPLQWAAETHTRYYSPS